MSRRPHLFTSESVSMGHPDKVADQVSDAIVDAMLRVDAKSRVAVETMVKTGMVILSGEVTCDGYVDIAKVVRDAIVGIGYDDGTSGFDGRSCAVLLMIEPQSPDIAQGVNEGEGLHKEQGAGDQGIMFGFACRETDVLMPLPIQFSHRLVERQAAVRRDGTVPGLRPDAKSQVTFEYDGWTPTRLDTVVISTQHGPEWNERQDALREQIITHVIKPVVGEWWRDDTKIHVNPTGRFEIGGPCGDCGLTGRKIIVDTYGGRGRHGGGAFSGKDPSKVDRSATYMARYIAKNIVAAELADVCEIQLSYAIGVAEPVSVYVDCMGTARIDEDAIVRLVREHFELTPSGIIRSLDLLKPIYQATSYHGHFGREPRDDGSFSWERTDKVDALRAAAGLATAATA